MKKLVFGSAAVAALGIGSVAMADTVTEVIDIEWGSSDTGEVATGLISLPALASIDSITLDLSHTWGSDLEIVITGPSGSSFVLMFDDVSSTFSGNFDLGAVADDGTLANVDAYEFVAPGGGTPDWTSPFSAAGTYDANTWTSGPLPAGDYSLSITDDAGGDPGAIGSWTITYTVPAPGALALLGFAGLVGGRRRRTA